jgi:endonuclease YncB( thermonuclease family)
MRDHHPAANRHQAGHHPSETFAKEVRMPKKTQALSTSVYAALTKDIRAILSDCQKAAAQAAGQHLVSAYWQIGRRIAAEEFLKDSTLAAATLKDLAQELNVDHSTLTRCLHFFTAYPEGVPYAAVNWSQYKLLLPIPDPAKRDWYARLAVDQQLSCEKLARAIHSRQYQAAQTAAQSRRKKHAGAPVLKRPTQATYVYKAIVEHVVDGDTLLVRIDLGFTTWKEQRLRLAGIDTPPIDTEKGIAASEFVTQALAPCKFVMIKTNKIDIYGRYVAHVFYRPGERDKVKVFERGKYLNQELMDADLAVVF